MSTEIGLEAVVGVDAEAEDRGDFDGLVVRAWRAGISSREGRRRLWRSWRLGQASRTRMLVQIARGIERAGHDHARARQALGKIGADRRPER